MLLPPSLKSTMYSITTTYEYPEIKFKYALKQVLNLWIGILDITIKLLKNSMPIWVMYKNTT